MSCFAEVPGPFFISSRPKFLGGGGGGGMGGEGRGTSAERDSTSVSEAILQIYT